MRCPACGADVVQEAVFCHKCGRRIDSPDEGFPDNQRDEAGPGVEPADSFREAVARRELQDEPERELWRGGYSSKAMIGGWVISGLVTLVLLVVGVLWVRQAVWWLVLLAVILLVWLYHVAVLCYRRMNVRYILSTQRFVHESGILRRVTDRIEVLDMDDITFEQGPLERLVGVGTIRIVSSDHSHPDLSLPGIENVKAVSEQFDDARLAERRRRGLHIEQI
ncbi:MAG: PH domain-containing protein [Planctomycetes bacterium]|nr:PH domain-containing protein [Planctomycetota bacterium]MCG2684218.1 PH domain-containing protein [Planctomycetales bacterium]